MIVSYVVQPDGTIDVREQPHKSEQGAEEMATLMTLHNVKDMMDGWSTFRASEARSAANLRDRGFHEYDSFKVKMEQEYLDERALARQFQSGLNAIFLGAYGSLLQGQVERTGTNQGALANQTLFDPQKVAESAIESGMAAGAQTNQVAQAGVQDVLLEILAELRKASTSD